MIRFQKYVFFAKRDADREAIGVVEAPSRFIAAKYFAKRKNLTLKQFLKIYTIPK